jgi:hypothetical protein
MSISAPAGTALFPPALPRCSPSAAPHRFCRREDLKARAISYCRAPRVSSYSTGGEEKQHPCPLQAPPHLRRPVPARPAGAARPGGPPRGARALRRGREAADVIRAPADVPPRQADAREGSVGVLSRPHAAEVGENLVDDFSFCCLVVSGALYLSIDPNDLSFRFLSVLSFHVSEAYATH